MRRSHPPTLLTLARRTLSGPCGLGKDAHILCAVSGGADSMALLHACCMLRDRGVIGRVSAHGVDHGLRAEAQDELGLARDLARAHEVPFSSTKVEVAPGASLQARARTARWAALAAAKAASGADVIATGHHRDDRAETVLIRILRGAPLAGLGVLPAREGDRIRPLIQASRADIAAHMQRHHVAWAEDPSNRSSRFLRVRVRLEVLPLLEQLSPRIREHLVDLAEAVLAQPSTFTNATADPRIESKRAMAQVRVLLKGGVVLSPEGAQALSKAESLTKKRR